MSQKIIPISKKDIETFRSATFARKAIKGEKLDKLKQKLTDYYSNNPNSIDAALSYAAFNILYGKTDDPFDQKEAIEEAIMAFQRILKLEERHWLARYYAAKLQSLFVEYYGDDEDQIKDIQELIELQNNVEHKPYFVLPYILMAKMLYNLDRKDEAIQYLEKAENFPVKPIQELTDFLGFLFIEFENKLRVIDENDVADRIKKLGQAYFPDIV
jgi:tetratricopeptide (TPR) repeat protein